MVVRIIWLALWITRLLQEMEKLDKPINKSSMCTIDLQNITLGILHDCQEVDNDCFKLLLYLSVGYILGEVLLLARIDVIGRKVFLGKCNIFTCYFSVPLKLLDIYFEYTDTTSCKY